MCTGGAAVCGDGVLTPPDELCESNSMCSMGNVCIKCLCAFPGMAVTFSDVMAIDNTVPLGRNLVRVTMTLAGPPSDTFDIVWGSNDGMARPGRVEICMKIREAMMEVQRLCYREVNDNDQNVVLATGAMEQALVDRTDYTRSTLASGGVRVVLKRTAGLRLERALSFHWESSYDGVLADRLPDSGEIRFTEILGRE